MIKTIYYFHRTKTKAQTLHSNMIFPELMMGLISHNMRFNEYSESSI